MPDSHVACIVCRGGQSRSQPLGVSYKAMSSLVSSSVITIITFMKLRFLDVYFPIWPRLTHWFSVFLFAPFFLCSSIVHFGFLCPGFYSISFLKAFSFSSNLLPSLPLKPGLSVLSSANSHQPILNTPRGDFLSVTVLFTTRISFSSLF